LQWQKQRSPPKPIHQHSNLPNPRLMSFAQTDFYKILGVNDKAELAVIKAAYKALIMIYHPDRYSGDKTKAVNKTKAINEAYAVLIDPDKRKKYDAGRLLKGNTADKSGNVSNLIDELKRTLEESEVILKILNEPD